MRTISAREPRWRAALPRLVAIDRGQSLAGAVLAHEFANRLDAGALFRQTRRHRTGMTHMGRPGAHLIATGFDRAALACLLGLDTTELASLTAQPLVERAYAGAALRSRTLGQRTSYALCPDCAVAQRIPLVSLFAAVWGCAEHRLRLVLRCSCRGLISPFRAQRPWTCHSCGQPYATLRHVPIRDHDEQVALERWVALYEQLLALPIDLPGELRDPLRALLLLRRIDRRVDTRVLYLRITEGRAPLALIAKILCVTASMPADLLQMSHPAMTGSGPCPSPSCPGDLGSWGSERSVLICRRCGTRSKSGRVLFSFDPAAAYPTWRALRNRERLEDLRARMRHAARRGGSLDEVFERAGVPRSLAYRTPRAGLTQIAAGAAA